MICRSKRNLSSEGQLYNYRAHTLCGCLSLFYLGAIITRSHRINLSGCGGLTLAGCQMPTQLLFHSPSATGQRGENNMGKVMGQDKYRKISNQLLSWSKHI